MEVRDIETLICQVFDLEMKAFFSNRNNTACDARKVFYLIYRQRGWTFASLAKHFQLDHSTVIHAYNAAIDHIVVDEAFRTKYEKVVSQLTFEKEEISPRIRIFSDEMKVLLEKAFQAGKENDKVKLFKIQELYC